MNHRQDYQHRHRQPQRPATTRGLARCLIRKRTPRQTKVRQSMLRMVAVGSGKLITICHRRHMLRLRQAKRFTHPQREYSIYNSAPNSVLNFKKQH